MKTSTRFSLTLLLAAALNSPRLAPRVCAQTRDAGRAPAGATAARSNVRGRVVYADTGNPVRRCEVYIRNAGTGEDAGSAVTDARGEFSFRGLSAGRYQLAASAPSLADPAVIPRSDADTELLGLVENYDGFAEVELDGTKSAELVIRARRGGAITGRVTYEDDEPVAGAQLRLFRLRQGQLARVTSTWQALDADKRFLTTDSRGVYRIGGLPAGEYVVRASDSDLGGGAQGEEGDLYGDGSLVVAYFPSAGSVKEAAPVRVYEGRDTDRVDIRIPERPVRKLGGGVTLKRGGSAVGGAEITVSRKDEGPFRERGFGDESARTDAEGRWEVLGVPDGEYVVTLHSVVSFVRDSNGGSRGVNVVPLRREVTVSGADLTDLKFEVETGGRVSGTVTVEGGKVIPEHLGVEAFRDEEQLDWTFVRDGGKFELDTIPAGEVRLRATDFPADRFYVKSLTLNQTNLLHEPIRVVEGAVVEGVRLVLSADVIPLKGQALARRDGSTPLARALVLIVPADEKLRRAGARPRVVRADAKGRFETAGGPGDYLLVALTEKAALKQSLRIDEEYVRRARASFTRVTLKTGEKVWGVKVLGGDE